MKKIIEQIKLIFSNKQKRAYFFVFFLSYIIAEVGREFYRPYIYKNKINDFGFADTIGNTFGTIAIIFFIFVLVMHENFRKEPFFIPALVAFLIFYEIAQELIPGYRFDWKDVIATILAGIISFLIYLLINKNEKRIKKKGKGLTNQ